ncbi:MAG: response regulator [Candidatus Omnitrophota bacterium]
MANEKKVILIVDDEAGFVEALKFQLEAKKDVEVVAAYNGVEALEKLRFIKPDLIILDMNMPQMGGVELYKNICDSSGKTKYPVLILTARANLEELFKELKVDGFISKPFELDDLLKEVDTIMSKRARQAVTEKPMIAVRPNKVLIIENNGYALDKLAIAFLNAGYVVSSAKNGMAAFERVATEIPDLIMIRLGLDDLPGDIIAAKLKQTVGTKNSAIVLYTSEKNDDLKNYVATENICEKIGIGRLIQSDEPYILLREAEEALCRAKSKG